MWSASGPTSGAASPAGWAGRRCRPPAERVLPPLRPLLAPSRPGSRSASRSTRRPRPSPAGTSRTARRSPTATGTATTSWCWSGTTGTGTATGYSTTGTTPSERSGGWNSRGRTPGSTSTGRVQKETGRAPECRLFRQEAAPGPPRIPLRSQNLTPVTKGRFILLASTPGIALPYRPTGENGRAAESSRHGRMSTMRHLLAKALLRGGDRHTGVTP